jgi:hypothetical protein
MRRRSRAGAKSPNAQGQKTAARKSRIASKAVRHRGSADAIEETEFARVIRERDDALEQQTATSRVLQVISGSMFDLQTVLDTLVKTGVRLCQADQGAIWLLENNILKLAASCGQPSEFVRFSEENPRRFFRSSVAPPAILSWCSIPCWRRQSAICQAKFGNIYRWDGHEVELIASHNHRQADGAPVELCRPGRHRHRERAVAQ